MTRVETKHQYTRILDEAHRHGRRRQAFAELAKRDLWFSMLYVFHREDADNDWVYARAREYQAAPDGYLDLWFREGYKDEWTGTPTITANRGWTTHGELVVGDFVFSPSGAPVKVLALSKRYADSECYRVTFQDGSDPVIAGKGHVWTLRRRIKRRVGHWHKNQRRNDWAELLVTTEQLAGMKGRRDVGVCEPLQFTEAELPIAPYVLGAWLGDGNSSGGVLTCAYEDSEIIKAIRSCGVTVVERKSSNVGTGLFSLDPGIRGQKNTGMTSILRCLGLKNNKHIPEAYLRSSVPRRMELLRGLFDTDGHCSKQGKATFVNKNERLAYNVFELAAGLGLTPVIHRYNYPSTGIYWQVIVRAHTDRNPFKLARKAERAIPPSHYRGTRHVKSVDRVPTVPTICIQVEGGNYVTGRDLIPTHNSSIITICGIPWHLMSYPERTYGIVSYNRPLAKMFLRQIKLEIEQNPTLYEVAPDVYWENPKADAPKWSENDGLILKRKGNPKEATIEAIGMIEGQPAGPHYSDLHYEDPVTRDACRTPESLKTTEEMFKLSLNLQQAGGRKRAIGTRWHYADVYGSIIKTGTLTPRIWPATKNGKLDGEPWLWTREQLQERIRDYGPYIAACHLFLNPTEQSLERLKEEWLRYWRADRFNNLNLYMLCDPAGSKKKGSDYTVIAVVGLGSDRNYYVVTWIRDRLSLRERANVIFKWHQQYRPRNVGYEQYGMLSDIEHFTDRMERDNYRFEITSLGGPLGKYDRIARLVPFLSEGRWFFPFSTPYQQYDGTIVDLTKQFIEDEYKAHPFEVHDDMLDCISRIFDDDLSATFPMGEPIDPMNVNKSADADYDPLYFGLRE